MTAGCTFCS